jgi:ketosteroid isomerase-like protein
MSVSITGPTSAAGGLEPEEAEDAAMQGDADAATGSAPAATAPALPSGRPVIAGAPPPEAVDAAAADPSSPAAVADAFYDAFAAKDTDAMEAAYAPGVQFEDPIFSYSDRDGTMGMWRNLLPQGKDMHFSHEIEGFDGNVVSVHWVADYVLNGRPVHNDVHTQMTVEDGKIVDQRDSWSWEKWAKQALPLGDLSSLPAVRFAATELMRGLAMLPTK